MIRINVDPMLFHIGPFMISWYGIAVAVALTVGLWITLREARRKGLPTDPIYDLALWVVIGGAVGARLLHVLDRWDMYAANPTQILALQNGGLAIMGAILGGALAGGFAAWRRGLPIRRLFDAVAPGLVLGQAIGRFGCYSTGDTVGRATDGSWGVMYLNPGAMVPQLGVAYQPVFFYEQLLDVAIFVVLWTFRKRITVDGQMFALYLGLYAIGKFVLTFFRTEVVWFWGLQEAQLLSLGALLIAVVWAVMSRSRQHTFQAEH